MNTGANSYAILKWVRVKERPSQGQQFKSRPVGQQTLRDLCGSAQVYDYPVLSLALEQDLGPEDVEVTARGQCPPDTLLNKPCQPNPSENLGIFTTAHKGESDFSLYSRVNVELQTYLGL